MFIFVVNCGDEAEYMLIEVSWITDIYIFYSLHGIRYYSRYENTEYSINIYPRLGSICLKISNESEINMYWVNVLKGLILLWEQWHIC